MSPPGQSPPEHSATCSKEPRHPRPSFVALRAVRDRRCCPAPQVTLQLLQTDHTANAQFVAGASPFSHSEGKGSPTSGLQGTISFMSLEQRLPCRPNACVTIWRRRSLLPLQGDEQSFHSSHSPITQSTLFVQSLVLHLSYSCRFPSTGCPSEFACLAMWRLRIFNPPPQVTEHS